MCFQYLAFMTASAALFGVLSMLYAGRYSTRYRRVKRPLIVIVRLVLAACIAINSLVEFGAGFWMDKQRPYAVFTAELVSGVSWACHAVAMWVFSTSVTYKGRGPLVLNSGWYLTLIASILHFRSMIRWTQHHASYQYITLSEMYFTLLLRVAAYTHMGLQILYGVSFISGVSEARTGDMQFLQQRGGWKWRSRVVSIQNEDEEEDMVREKQPLIHSRFNPEHPSYGALVGPQRDNLNFDLSQINAYEDRANPLSLFVFWWVWPLLRRGARGYLEKLTDLPPVPQSLQTSRIRERFRNVLLRKQHTSDNSSADKSESVREASPLSVNSSKPDHESVLDSEVMLRSFTRSAPLPSAYTPEHLASNWTTGSGQSMDGASPLPRKDTSCAFSQQASRPTSLLFLFSAMNRTFGWHYYPLGLLKLTTDLLGFAGPLLLYRLVNFIENKKVSSGPCVTLL